MTQQSASQTVGPFFSIGMTYDDLSNLVRDDTVGERLVVEGRVLDGDGVGINDAVVEIWQADAHGVYNHPADERQTAADRAFFGFGRCATDEAGAYRFETIRPGPVGQMAPHLNVRLFMRGLLLHVVTRLYFDDDDLAGDPLLNSVPADRRPTLIARRDDRVGTLTYRLDFHMQGDAETVFFEP